ncbi:MAG: hypothetical protein H0T20_09850 [Actinobacteria bacterium]|nr:hypothetical protein [Actinomycetota bacterium]
MDPRFVRGICTGLAVDGVPIRDVYPYSRNGTLLFDILHFDENGNPVNILSGADDTSRRILADENGMQYFNSFPIRYFDPGTKTVGRPRLAPPIRLPSIVTPPLEQTPR